MVSICTSRLISCRSCCPLNEVAGVGLLIIDVMYWSKSDEFYYEQRDVHDRRYR